MIRVHSQKSKIHPKSALFACLSRYWFVAIPAILLNAVLTIDHVLAKNNEQIFTVTISQEALTALRQDDGAKMNETLQSHWVVTNDEGNIEGRISTIDPNQLLAIPIQRLDVTLLKKGERIRSSVTQNDGTFVLKAIEPGVYTLVAAGENGFLAYGVQVLPRLADEGLLDGNAKNNGARPSASRSKQAYYVSNFGVPASANIQESLQIDAAAVPPEFNTLEQIIDGYLPPEMGMAVGGGADGGGAGGDVKAIAKATLIGGGSKFPLEKDGSFNGRVQPIATEDGELKKLSEMNLFLLQNDVERKRVAIEENGKFKVENVVPGVYSIVAAGNDGFAALSIELVSAGAVQSLPGELNAAMDRQGAYQNPTEQYVSTHGATAAAQPQGAGNAISSLGIAFVSDRGALQFIRKEIKRIVQLRRDLAQQQQPANPFFDQQFPGQPAFQSAGVGSGGFAPGGFGPGGFSSAPGFSPLYSGGPGFSGNGGGFGGGRLGGGRLLPWLAAIPGIVAISIREPSAVDPGPSSPTRTVVTSAAPIAASPSLPTGTDVPIIAAN